MQGTNRQKNPEKKAKNVGLVLKAPSSQGSLEGDRKNKATVWFRSSAEVGPPGTGRALPVQAKSFTLPSKHQGVHQAAEVTNIPRLHNVILAAERTYGKSWA